MDFNINNESGNAVLQTIHASEGGKALKLIRQRQKMQKDYEDAKHQIESNTKRKHQVSFWGSAADALEEAFSKETIGLVSAETFREKRQKLTEQIENATDLTKKRQPEVKVAKKGKVVHAKLSFSNEDDDEEDGPEEATSHIEKKISVPSGAEKKKHMGKDPTVDTHFLADPERDAKLEEERDMLIKEYYARELSSKKEILKVTYSYWDGTGHRRVIRVSKDTTIGTFLEMCRKDLEKNFHELRAVNSENLMYIKEDLILPHSATFYDLIKSKARGKSGPLFHFDVHDDVRMISDARVEKDESHAGKIVDKKWYERNRHIFPASRWEVYNPAKSFDTYTTHGHEVSAKAPPKF